MYLRLMIDGLTSKPFSAVSLHRDRETISRKETVIAASEKNYAGMPIAEPLLGFEKSNNQPALFDI